MWPSISYCDPSKNPFRNLIHLVPTDAIELIFKGGGGKVIVLMICILCRGCFDLGSENLVSSTTKRGENRSTSLSKLMPIEYKEADKNLQFKVEGALAPVVCLLDDEIWLKSCTIAGSWESKKSLTRRHFHPQVYQSVLLGVFFIPFEGLLKILSADAIGIASPMRYFAIGKFKLSVSNKDLLPAWTEVRIIVQRLPSSWSIASSG